MHRSALVVRSSSKYIVSVKFRLYAVSRLKRRQILNFLTSLTVSQCQLPLLLFIDVSAADFNNICSILRYKSSSIYTIKAKFPIWESVYENTILLNHIRQKQSEGKGKRGFV